ncbi:hypothetical protein V1264_015022 [Littorina saxatilis]|uniref:Insulin-like domain-containing protein n=2 Tax=Littorina saxatilis TaxID=31220 RepID=A0AAN9BKA1_9CAEN
MTVVAGLMVVLLMSLSAAQVRPQRVLCGRTLADALDLVCANRGFHFNKRSANSGTKQPAAGASAPSSAPAAEGPARVLRSVAEAGPALSVVDECCRRPCSYDTLESYCAPAGNRPTAVGSETDLIQLFSGNQAGRRVTTQASTTFTTTQSTAHYDPNSPSAEVFRGPHRGHPAAHGNSGKQFFYVQVGSRPTRNPLITE